MTEKLPTPPELTDDQLALNDVVQKRRRNLASIASSGDQRKVARERAVAEHFAPIPLKDMTPAMKGRYAQSLAAIGDFKTAYKLTKEPFYKEVEKVLRQKTRPCKCQNLKTMVMEDGNPVEKSYSTLYVKTTVFDGQNHCDLMACNNCGEMFTR